MADEAQVKLLKEKGVQAWNEWRRANPLIRPNLSFAKLVGEELIEVDFFEVDLQKANLKDANLDGADLSRAFLQMADLLGARLSRAKLHTANLVDTNLRRAELCSADLREANIGGANLSEASLVEANLNWANLAHVNLNFAEVTGTDFANCFMDGTQLGNVDLSQSKGLAKVAHTGPSTIGIDTIYRSCGNIPEEFLRGAGVPEPFIVQMKSLVAAMSPIEFYSCFISYSSKDQEFAERLHADLRGKNVRCWFAPEDLKIGDRLRPAFDEAIRVHDKLMVLLSENSVSSPWVEKEVETAFEKERREKRTVLFPIRLDDAVMETDQAWAADIRRTRHIGDFRDWKNHDSYKKAFERLLRDLKA